MFDGRINIPHNRINNGEITDDIVGDDMEFDDDDELTELVADEEEGNQLDLTLEVFLEIFGYIEDNNLSDFIVMINQYGNVLNNVIESEGVILNPLLNISELSNVNIIYIYELLRVNNINVNIVDTLTGFSPLFYAVRNNRLDMVRLFIDNGADIYLRAHNGLTVFDIAFSINNPDIIDALMFEAERRRRLGSR